MFPGSSSSSHSSAEAEAHLPPGHAHVQSECVRPLIYLPEGGGGSLPATISLGNLSKALNASRSSKKPGATHARDRTHGGCVQYGGDAVRGPFWWRGGGLTGGGEWW